MSGREPFTVRLSTDLVGAVRARARDEGHPSVATLVEAALRLYLASTKADAERAALLSQVEEGLINRLDKRLGRAVEGLRDIAAKANYDQSLTLCLLHETLSALFGKDRQTYEEIMKRAKKEAAILLRRVSAVSPEAEAAAVAELKGRIKHLHSTIESLEKTVQSWRNDAHKHEADARYWQQMAQWEGRRYSWAKERYENQPQSRFGRRRPLEDFLQEYETAMSKPAKRSPA